MMMIHDWERDGKGIYIDGYHYLDSGKESPFFFEAMKTRMDGFAFPISRLLDRGAEDCSTEA